MSVETMELFKKIFPSGSQVSVRVDDSGQVCVSVHTPRPDPVWLKDGAVTLAKVSEDDIRSGLLAAVVEDPGRGPSHYVRIPMCAGGIKGSQERKEAVLKQMIEDGTLVVLPLPNPVGRRTVGVVCAGQGLPSAVDGV